MENWIEHISQPLRLFLAWQAPDHLNDRFRWAVGVLGPREGVTALRYFQNGSEFEAFNQGRTFERLLALGYRGYPGFSLRREVHDKGVLEALMRRLPPRSRQDFGDYKRQFRLPSQLELSDLALLARTEAKLPSDGFSVVDPLDAETEWCDLLLEIAGFRYYVPSEPLQPDVGCPIEITPEPDNQFDPSAVQICMRSRKIGNVNRLQAATFLRWLVERRVSGALERLNGTPDKPRAYIFVRVRPAANRAAA